jgi:ribosome-binding factor A
MRYQKHRKRGVAPPLVDPLFAEALSSSHRHKEHRSKQDHKARQIGRQVQRILSLVLTGDGDDVLRELYIDSVAAAPGSSQLLVHVVIPHHISVADAMQRLGDATPRLRREIAQAITRKRVPELNFVPMAAGEVEQ